MKTSPKMQAAITALALKHGLDLSAEEASLRLEMPGYLPLVIEKVGRYKVSVAHYYAQNGDLVPDPDVVFFTNTIGGVWVPMMFQNVLKFDLACELNSDETKIERYYPNVQKSIASFVEGTWASNIKAQGWLERGARPAPSSTDEDEPETATDEPATDPVNSGI